MTPRVGIVDYGSSNLLSVARAFANVGAAADTVDTPDTVARAERLVLPGVGAFGKSRDGLLDRDLWEPVSAFMRSGKPFLGICVGMQLMLESSEEFGAHEGFGLIAGHVTAIPKTGADGKAHKIPHIGWNRLSPINNEDSWHGTILEGIEPGSSVYFVHSFTSEPEDASHRLADTDYNGYRISAAVNRENAYGCQFHCEKSGAVGLRIIENFLKL